jgi:hypothetical protein
LCFFIVIFAFILIKIAKTISFKKRYALLINLQWHHWCYLKNIFKNKGGIMENLYKLNYKASDDEDEDWEDDDFEEDEEEDEDEDDEDDEDW